MQCPQCQTEVGAQSTFCGNCGASLAAAAPDAIPPAAAYAAPAGVPVAAYPAPVVAASSGLSPNAAAAISYVTIIPAILFLVIEPYNKIPLVRFHSFQSIGLAVVWFAFWVVMVILSMLIAIVPGLRLILFIFPIVQLLIGLGFFVVWLITLLKASKGEWYKLPFIGDFAMKQAQS